MSNSLNSRAAATRLKKYQDVHDFYKWMEESGEAEIVSFQIDAEHLLEFEHDMFTQKFDNNMWDDLTGLIDMFLDVSHETKHLYAHGKINARSQYNGEPLASYPHRSDENAYCVYRMLKLIWLYKDIEKFGQHQPLQMHMMGDSYRFHPGSDKQYSLYFLSTALKRPIDVFYIHYKRLDKYPIYKHFDYKVLDTPDKFISMFHKFDSDEFNILMGDVQIHNPKVSRGEKGYVDSVKQDWDKFKKETSFDHFDVFSNTLVKSLHHFERSWPHNVTEDLYDIKHISYNDCFHHIGMSRDLKDILNIKHSIEDGIETLTYEGVFKLRKLPVVGIGHRGTNMWMPDHLCK